MKNLLLASCVLLCTACVSVPKKLELPENTNTVTFSQAIDSSANVTGGIARWGGVIASVKNNANNTMVEVVNFPLLGTLRPKQGDETKGRFRLYFNGLLDPVIYKQGRSITAVGTISDTENGTIGEHKYQFPVLKEASVHLWKNIERVDMNVSHQPAWYFDPFYWSNSHINYNRPIIIHRSSNVPNKQPTKPLPANKR